MDTGKLEHDSRFVPFGQSIRDVFIQNTEKVLKKQLLNDHDFGGFIHSTSIGG